MEEANTYELVDAKCITTLDLNPSYEVLSTSNQIKSVVTSEKSQQMKSQLKKPTYSWVCYTFALVGIILVGSAAFASLALTVWNSSQVNHQRSSAAKLEQMLTMLQNSRSELGQRILQLQNSLNDYNEFQGDSASCSQILLLNSSSPSGHYWIRSSNDSAVRVYCDFNRQCGCDGPSTWTRVAFLNMSDPNHVCPCNWTTITSPLRACGRGEGMNRGCSSVYYSTFGLTYSRVCGHIIAHQSRNTDAFLGLIQHSFLIDQPYVDGVSLTLGSAGSRQHIWSFASAIGEEGPFLTSWLCACSNSNNWPHSTSFVGNDYFCDTGNHGDNNPYHISHFNDSLWDGQGCGPSSTCCQFNNPPWFCKTLNQSTTSDLEVRICKNSGPDDTPIQLLELYIQ